MEITPIKFEQEYNISELLNQVRDGDLKLPYFQREFVWSTKDMKDLLASILVGLPVGSLLLLKAKKDHFSIRNIEGVHTDLISDKQILFLLDGQQRTTAIYSIFTSSTETSLTRLSSKWFIDMNLFFQESEPFTIPNMDSIEPERISKDYIKCFDPQKANKKYFQDYSNNNTIKEFRDLCKNEKILPVDIIYFSKSSNDTTKLFLNILNDIASSFMFDIQTKFKDEEERKKVEEDKDIWRSEVKEYLGSMLKINLPAITFKPTQFDRAIQAFEILNKAGVKLHVFDLLVARAGRGQSTIITDQFYQIIKEKLQSSFPVDSFGIEKLKTWSFDYFFYNPSKLDNGIKDQIVGLLTARISFHYNKVKQTKDENGKLEDNEKVSISNTYLFDLPIKECTNYLNEYIEDVMLSLLRTYAFLQCRCGVINLKKLHYRLISIPIAFYMNDEIWNDSKKLDLIEGWYWSTIFSNKLEYDQSTVIVKQIKFLGKVLAGDNKISLKEVFAIKDRTEPSGYIRPGTNCDSLLKCVSGGIYNTILQYILSRKPNDFVSDDKLTAWDAKILNDHHILPLGADKKIGVYTKNLRKDKKNIKNSILNRTLISEEANRIISDYDFEKYKEVLSNVSTANHLIPISTNNYSDIHVFLKERFNLLNANVINSLNSLIEE